MCNALEVSETNRDYAADRENFDGRFASFESWLARLIEHQADVIGTLCDEKSCTALGTQPTLKRLLRQTQTGTLHIDRAAVAREDKLDGKFPLRTSDETLTAADTARSYKWLYEAERGWRDLKPRSTSPRSMSRSPWNFVTAIL